MSREDPQMKLRMPPELRDRIFGVAQANKRSMNAEIVARLEASFPSDRSPPTSGPSPKSPAMRAISEKVLQEIEAVMEKYTAIAQQLAKDEAAGVEAAPAKPRSRLLDI